LSPYLIYSVTQKSFLSITTKALHQRTGEGFAVVCGCTLFLMAFGTFGNGKSLLAIVAGTAGFPIFHFSHLEGSFFHAEEFWLTMTVGALKTRGGMRLTIEHDLTVCSTVVFNFFRGTLSQRKRGQTEKETDRNNNAKNPFHKNLHVLLIFQLHNRLPGACQEKFLPTGIRQS
jgi:hypothetical protein